MDSVALWDDLNDERIERRIIRDASNVMSLSDKSFVQNFRLSKEAFLYVLSNIKSELKTPQRSSAIPEIIKLSATLRFFAQGGYQHLIGQDRHLGLAQQTVSSCLMEVCNAVEKVLCPKHIVFSMTNEEKCDASRSFYSTCGIPGVIGAVDRTHIQLIRSSKDEHLFFNRKLKHSINAMVICDHKMRIRAVNGTFGGASHDSHVWNLSREREYMKTNFENGDKNIRILGNSFYAALSRSPSYTVFSEKLRNCDHTIRTAPNVHSKFVEWHSLNPLVTSNCEVSDNFATKSFCQRRKPTKNGKILKINTIIRKKAKMSKVITTWQRYAVLLDLLQNKPGGLLCNAMRM